MNSTNNMNYTTKKNNFRFFILAIFMFLFYTTSNAQTNPEKLANSTTFTNISTEAKDIVSMDFAIWFMGTINNTEKSTISKTFSKKQLINSGIITNSVLIRSFLKKISNQESSIS